MTLRVTKDRGIDQTVDLKDAYVGSSTMAGTGMAILSSTGLGLLPVLAACLYGSLVSRLVGRVASVRW